MYSIRLKTMVMTVAAILTTILCVFAAAYFTLHAGTEQTSAMMMDVIAADSGKSVEKYTESIEQSMEMITNMAVDWLDTVALADCGAIGADVDHTLRTPEQAARLDAYLAEYCSRVRESFGSVATHTHGVVTYYYCINPEISENEHGFFYSRVGKTGFEVQPPLDARELDPEDIAHTTWYYTPIQRGRPSWVGPYSAHFLDELWTYSFIVPIYKSGTFIGVIGMDIPFDTLVSQINSIRVFRSGYACLVGDDGRVLYHPLIPKGSPLEALGVEGLAEKLANKGNSELMRYDDHGEVQQLSFYTLSNGMKLLISAPVAEINASWSRLMRVVTLISLGILVFFSALLLFVMGVMTRPLQELTAASRRLADGDYDVELKDYRSRDEVGALTRSFTAMRDQQKQTFEELNRQIYTDTLTGLPNMRYFYKLASDARREMLEQGQRPAMLYFNLIGMKQYNRQFGFAEGDQLIRRFGEVLSRHYPNAPLGRIGQDHFAVLTVEKGLEDTIHAIFKECEGAGRGILLPVSVGIYPDSLEDVSIPVACDRAKYACDEHRGAYVSGIRYFDDAMLKRGETFRYIIEHLDEALEKGWVVVYYQSIIRAVDGKVCDEEALARWIDPNRGFLSPADFIPALEDSKLIYKLDLYVVEQVLKKMKRQAEAGIYVVPQSVNLSRHDFDTCDIVEEIRRRVDDAGIPRHMLTIEITESVIGSDFDFMKVQVERFQALGFPVWMDDFGSGYSSLDVLKNIHFDLIKFDMRFLDNFDNSDNGAGKIILTELTKMAIGLGIETVCEGAEELEQVEFLREIGCTRIQGYYYGRPQSFETMLEKHRNGEDLGFENPEESEYFAAIGRVNLYDMGMLADGEDDTDDGSSADSLRRFFDTLPMAIMEVDDDSVRYNRCNKSYRDFMERMFGVQPTGMVMETVHMTHSAFIGAVLRCSRDGNRAIIDEPLDEKTTVHAFLRRVAVNPVTDTAAVAVAVLAIVDKNRNDGASFVSIARALSSDYINIYYVDTETGQFIEYTSAANGESGSSAPGGRSAPTGSSAPDLTVERRGGDFFGASARNARTFIDPADQDYFIESFTRENVLRSLDEHGAFTITYRLLMAGTPTYVHMKAVRMRMDPAHIIMASAMSMPRCGKRRSWRACRPSASPMPASMPSPLVSLPSIPSTPIPRTIRSIALHRIIAASARPARAMISSPPLTATAPPSSIPTTGSGSIPPSRSTTSRPKSSATACLPFNIVCSLMANPIAPAVLPLWSFGPR